MRKVRSGEHMGSKLQRLPRAPGSRIPHLAHQHVSCRLTPCGGPRVGMDPFHGEKRGLGAPTRLQTTDIFG